MLHTYHHKSDRFLFVDMLRFLAVMLMLQGHTFEAFLSADIKKESWYFVHDLFHGLTAPMFLFSSGVAFGISTFKKWEDHIEIGFPIYKRISRFVGLIILGYALHLPFYDFFKLLFESTESNLLDLFQVDALQCIAVTLLFLQILAFIIKDEKRFMILNLTFALIIIFISPILYNLNIRNSIPIWIGSYINNDYRSWFPLFPWSGYTMLGIVFAYYFIEEKEHEHAVVLIKKIVLFAIVIGAISFILSNLNILLYPPHDFWKANPLVVFGRLSVIILIMSSLFYLEQKIHIKSKVPTIIGSESLFIYVVHLIIIYGSVLNLGLKYLWGGKFNVLQSLAVFVFLLLFMTWFAVFWHHGKIKYRKTFIYLRIGFIILFIFFFLY